MKKMKLSLVFVLGFFSIFIGLQAELQFSIADTMAVGGMSFGNTIQLNGTHYVSVDTYRVSLYQVQNGVVSLLDQELSSVSCGYFISQQFIGNRLYLLTALQGVLVYDISDTEVAFVTELNLNSPPGRERQNTCLKIFGATMVTGYVYSLPDSTSFFGSYDVYDISDVSSPSLLAGFDLPGNGNILTNVLQAGSAYYLITSSGDIYSTPNLAQLSTVDVLLNLPSDEMIMNSFLREGTIYLLTMGPFGTSLVKCSQQTPNQLGVAWMLSLPFWYCSAIWQENDRVILSGMVGSENKLLAYLPGENTWTLQFQRNLNLSGLFVIPEGYLGFDIRSVRQFDSSLNQTQVLYQGESFIMRTLVAGRYAIMSSAQQSGLLQIYDLQTRSWLDYSSSRQYYIPRRSNGETQIMFYSGADCDLLTFAGDGSYVLSSFSYPDSPMSRDVWGNRVLASYNGTLKAISVYEISGNTLNLICTVSTPVDYASTNFYDADHIVDRGYRESLGGYEIDFYRINNGSLQLLSQYPIPNTGIPYVTADRLTLGVKDSPIFDLTDPDEPTEEAGFELAISDGTEISFDGQDRYLIGPNMDLRYYLAHADFTNLTTFRATNLFCCGRNKMLASDTNRLIILQYQEPVQISDPSLPEPETLISSTYPNPFRDNLSLELQIKENSDTRVEVFNLKGQKVKELYMGKAKQGQLHLNWDATDDKGIRVSAGIYLFRINNGSRKATLKAIYMKN